jgi:hypothetical protein
MGDRVGAHMGATIVKANPLAPLLCVVKILGGVMSRDQLATVVHVNVQMTGDAQNMFVHPNLATRGFNVTVVLLSEIRPQILADVLIVRPAELATIARTNSYVLVR